MQIMHEIMKVNLPIEFRVRRLRKISPGLLPAASIFQKFLINIERILEM
jgi:hypothetical protein